MFDHLDELRRDDVREKQWDLSVAWSIMAPKAGRQRLWRSVRQVSLRSWRAATSPYAAQDDATRLLMIGAALNANVESGGKLCVLEGEQRDRLVEAWLESHPYEAEWLESQGVSPAEARRRHLAWLERQERFLQGARVVGLTPGMKMEV